MLNLVMKEGDVLEIGDDVKIKLQGSNRARIVIEAPKEVNIKRVAAKKALEDKDLKEKDSLAERYPGEQVCGR